MTRTIFARLALGILLSIILFWVWYSVAADYGYSAVAGTYTLQQSGETSTLVLRPDRSFLQEVTRAGRVERELKAVGDALVKAALFSQRSS
jgi:hypothetical protein